MRTKVQTRSLVRTIGSFYPSITIHYKPITTRGTPFIEISSVVQKKKEGIPYLIPVLDKFELNKEHIPELIERFNLMCERVEMFYSVEPENELSNKEYFNI